MRLAILIFSVVSAAVLLNGCSPDLAQTPLSEEENQWKRYLKENYPGWEPPQTIIPENPDIPPGAKATRTPSPVEPYDEQVTTEAIESSESRFDQEDSVVTTDESSKVEQQARDKSSSPAISYTVKKGDTLSAIAKKHYNKASAWKRIHEANIALIPNPHQLKPGTTLKIPQP